MIAIPALAQQSQPACRVIDTELASTYYGGCRSGLAHGRGIATGIARYEGEFRKGLKHGRGVKTWAWGDRYEGEFWRDMKHGQGVYAWGPGSQWAGQRYEGQFVEDHRQGYGVYTWPDGDRFEGHWTKDQRLGPASMEKRRELARAAQLEAFKAGVTVCKVSAASKPSVGLVKGAVESFDGAVLRVKLLEQPAAFTPSQRAAVETGQVVTDEPVNWTPCA